MADDPYSVLGVARTASDEEIRRAYRKLAKQHHPDLNPNNTQAAERFKKITAANDIVGDPEKRKQFDRGEIDAKGEQRRPQWRTHAGAGRAGAGMGNAGGSAGAGAGGGAGAGFEGGFGFSDVFSDLFGEGGPMGRHARGGGFATRGQDVRYTLEVEFLEAVAGAKKRVTLPQGGVLDLAVPEGVADGQVLRLKGKGGASPAGGEPGDALVEISIRPHAKFKREGNDILIDVPISIDEAVLGAKIEVPTITGRVAVSVPKATSSGRVLRLKGKGVRNPQTGTVGDQLVSLRIVLPDPVDEGLAYFLSEWRQKHRYDPGRD